MDHDERVALKHAHEVRVPPHADALAEQREWNGIEGAADLDVAIGMDGPLAREEERKGVGPSPVAGRVARPRRNASRLAAGRAVNAQPCNGAIPVSEERVVRVEAVEASALQGVGLDVASTALLLPVRVDVFNVLNRKNYDNPELRINNVDFGRITGASGSRFFQFGDRLTF